MEKAEEAVVWFVVWLGVWQHVESGTEQSFVIKINPPWAVENVSWRLKYPCDGRRWKTRAGSRMPPGWPW
jgi:hypothetical protein